MEKYHRGDVAAKRGDVDRLMSTAIKHYVRKHVWLPIAIERSQRLNRPINYFTLTTSDLLDVKVLERKNIIEKTGRGYPGVGFCEFDDKTFDEISRKLQRCSWSYKGSFEKMVLEHPHFNQDFAFDVVNLDFILVPFPGRESPLKGTWGAIRKLLEVQWEKQVGFDLFLTFRGSPEGTNEKALINVAELLKQNLENGRGFEEFHARVGHDDPFKLLKDDYVTFLCVGLPKLLVGDALDIGFQISRADAYIYVRNTDDEPYYIVKFAFGLEISHSNALGFAETPLLVSDYETWVPHVFEKAVIDVSELLQSNCGLQKSLEADLEFLKNL